MISELFSASTTLDVAAFQNSHQLPIQPIRFYGDDLRNMIFFGFKEDCPVGEDIVQFAIIQQVLGVKLWHNIQVMQVESFIMMRPPGRTAFLMSSQIVRFK